MSIRVNIDKRKLMELSRECPERANQVIQKIAQDVERDIKQNFSSQSPSPIGGAPGVDTGTLTNSIIAEPIGGGEWRVRDGVEYGIHLEYGTVKMAARPFFLPAIERVAQTIPPNLLEDVVK